MSKPKNRFQSGFGKALDEDSVSKLQKKTTNQTKKKHRKTLCFHSVNKPTLAKTLLSSCLVVELSCCLVVLLSYCLVVLLSCCLVVLLSCCRVVLLSCCLVVLLSCCFVVLKKNDKKQ